MIAKIGTFEMHNKRKLWSKAGASIAAAFLFALRFAIPAGAQTTTPQPPSTHSQDIPDWQKAAGGKKSFEVASIRQSKPGTFAGSNFGLNTSESFEAADPQGRLIADAPLAVYIEFAYKIKLTDEQGYSMLVRLPNWVSTDNFEINAKAEGNPTKDQMRLMMQSLLAERLKLAIHFETQQIPALALILDHPGKTGPKLRPHSEGPPCEVPAALKETEPSSKNFVYPPICNLVAASPKGNHGMLMGTRNATMKQIGDAIASVGDQGRPVVDRTGLRGRFDFTLEWTPDANSPVSSNVGGFPAGKTFDLLEALKVQLGLKLKSTNATIRVPVIDRVERPIVLGDKAGLERLRVLCRSFVQAVPTPLFCLMPTAA
jgi:bla regulator protein BlaR1